MAKFLMTEERFKELEKHIETTNGEMGFVKRTTDILGTDVGCLKKDVNDLKVNVNDILVKIAHLEECINWNTKITIGGILIILIALVSNLLLQALGKN